MKNRDRLRIMELEDAVQRGRNTIEFLLGCLYHPEQYKHSYPDQTVKALEKLNEVYPAEEGCPHSVYSHDCESCINSYTRDAEKRKLEHDLANPHWLIGDITKIEGDTFWCLLKEKNQLDKELEADITNLTPKQLQIFGVGLIVRYDVVNNELEFMLDTDKWI